MVCMPSSLPACIADGDLVGLALADEVGDRRRRHHHLGGDDPADPARVLHEGLRRRRPAASRELRAHLPLLVRREDVDHAVDRLRRVLRVQRREDEVAGLGGGERDRDRLEVAELADRG